MNLTDEQRRAFFEEMEARVEHMARDGMTADGVYSAALEREQRSVISGFRLGRLAALRAIERL